MTFDVVEETWNRTTLGSKAEGDTVNLERAMAADGRFDGHLVQGHIEGVGIVTALSPSPSPDTGEGSDESKVIRRLNRFRYPPTSVVRNAKEMRKDPTQAEEVLWNALRRKQLNNMYFRRQRPVGRFILDFYCDECRLGIEVDGSVHDSEEEKEYDMYRDDELDARGVRMLRFTNDDVVHNLPGVLQKIAEQAQQSSPPPDGGGVRGGGMILTVSLPQELIKFCVHKGSITIDGVSLTIAGIERDRSEIAIALVPHTLENTTLGSLKNGENVNIETDIIGRYLYAYKHEDR